MADAPSPDREVVSRLQERLTERGYGRHVPDGIYGPATRDVLTGLMREAQWESRAYAVLGLAKRADSVAVARDAAELDPNPRVRAWARYALTQSVVALRDAGGSDK